MPDEPEWLKNWKFAQEVKRLPSRIATDIKETAHDLVDEPAEVPYRLRQRFDDYLRPDEHVRPRIRVSYPDPSKPK